MSQTTTAVALSAHSCLEKNGDDEAHENIVMKQYVNPPHVKHDYNGGDLCVSTTLIALRLDVVVERSLAL